MKGLVELNSRVKKIKSLLNIGKSDFRIVRIWGMGGIDKTTIADALFKQVFKEFEGKFFMENVKEKSEKIGFKSLQKKIISYLLEQSLEV